MVLLVDCQRELYLDLFAPQIKLDLDLAGSVHFMRIQKAVIACFCTKADIFGVHDVNLLILDS